MSAKDSVYYIILGFLIISVLFMLLGVIMDVEDLIIVCALFSILAGVALIQVQEPNGND